MIVLLLALSILLAVANLLAVIAAYRGKQRERLAGEYERDGKR